MPRRKKTDLTYITNSSKRNLTFKKRTNGLMKKIYELSTLCGIEASAIIYKPDNLQPEIWPSKEGVQNVISNFRAKSEQEQKQRIFNQETFLKMMITKTETKVKKIENENKKAEISILMSEYVFNALNIFDNIDIDYLNDITCLTDQKLDQINRKIDVIQAQRVTQGEQAPVDYVYGYETNVIQGEQAHVDYVYGSEANVDYVYQSETNAAIMN